MNYHASKCLLFVLIFLLSSNPTQSTEAQCQADCEVPPTLRILGPTRASDPKDTIGTELLLTKPHPYSQAPMEAAVVRFNSTVRLTMPHYDSAEHSLTAFHTNYVLRSLKKIAIQFVSNSLKVTKSSPPADLGGGSGWYTDIEYMSEYVVDFTGNYNLSTTDEFLAVVHTAFETAAATVASPAQNNLTSTLLKQSGRSGNELVRESLKNATVTLPAGYARPSVGAGSLVEFMRLQTPNPNPYSGFCAAGCTFFFNIEVTSTQPAALSTCTDRCDETYRSKEHITVGYSDLADTARMECRDGCAIALSRCQPGYKCTQTQMYMEGGVEKYTEGYMNVCPPGTYRDVSYNQVEDCYDCPTGRYREDEKGRYMKSCSQCPVGKYVNETGSESILKCLRCPAGRYGKVPGLTLCVCITPASCADPQEFESPADAEKRASFPFIGRW
ncbi:hypothetical protein TrRE_jg4723 [Triparma retinervis]|uniref:Tyrosine-protein kinase ephrin type A/B receptor-like domain-containing protein n=1 Tax=Triparma retinervis TaxID=2557542 RepID=A0A9W7CE53_9STRA|nr:hypothetical protein TrRE_jg4723 [Triparma retinervis]